MDRNRTAGVDPKWSSEAEVLYGTPAENRLIDTHPQWFRSGIMEPASWAVLGLGKNVLRFLLECRHRSDERDGTVADARNTEGGQTTR